MGETMEHRFEEWQSYGGSTIGGRWGVGVARDILVIEARLAALEKSSRPVQPATETAAAGANDPGREGEPAESDGPGDGWRRLEADETVQSGDEANAAVRWNDEPDWRPVSPSMVGRAAPDPKYPAHTQYRRRITPSTTEASDEPGDEYRWVEVGERLEVGDECNCSSGQWRKLNRVCDEPRAYRRRITPAEAVPSPAARTPAEVVAELAQPALDFGKAVAAAVTPAEAVPDDAGRRLVNGEPMTAAEMMHALTVAIEEIRRLTAERDAARAEVERTIAARNAAIGERDEFRKSWLSATDHATRLVSQRDAALAEVERHRMTREERADDAYLRVGNPQRIPVHPCPFCGCDEEEETYEDMALTVFRDTSHSTWHLVQCRCCNASGPTGDGIDGAIKLWNRPLKGYLDRTKEGE